MLRSPSKVTMQRALKITRKRYDENIFTMHSYFLVLVSRLFLVKVSWVAAVPYADVSFARAETLSHTFAKAQRQILFYHFTEIN